MAHNKLQRKRKHPTKGANERRNPLRVNGPVARKRLRGKILAQHLREIDGSRERGFIRKNLWNRGSSHKEIKKALYLREAIA